MPKDALFIDKSIQETPALDFRKLLDEGIAAIQQMAGENWTDYNIHDPGVTILEQLCYALTELGYRANFKFEDLLASQFNPGRTQDTYYSAARIMPSNPITINDFRKLLIDRVDGLRNIWIDPLNVSKDTSQIRGVYMAFAEASPESVITPEDHKRLKKDIWAELTKYSNIAEAFERVVVLERIEMFVKAEIELTYEADVDEVHAQLLFNLSHSMTRPMTFKTLEQMLEAGKPITEIFEGPRLHHGFIDDSDLVRKITMINATTFVTPIKDVEGIAHVRSLNVYSNEEDSDEALQDIDAVDTGFIEINKIPVFGNKLDGPQLVRYYKHNAEIKPDIANVKKILDRLEQTTQVSHDYSSSSYYDLAVPQGEKMELGHYYSFQNHFPVIYGLGAMGLPPSIRGKKKVAVLQLKGYLILFDQILANYFAQLEHFSDLFSLDPDLDRSYFGGTIQSVDNIRLMVAHLEEPDLPDAVFTKRLRSVANHALRAIDHFNDRRNRFLDHLLARFGERIGHYGISQFNVYHSPEEQKKRLISVKTTLLSNLVKLSKNRSRSFNYAKEYWGQTNTSMMEWKLKILLDLPGKTIRLAAHNHELWRYFQKPETLHFAHIFAHLHAEKISPVEGEIMELEPDWANLDTHTEFIPGLRLDHEMLTGIFEPGNLTVVELRAHHHTRFLLLYGKEIEVDTLDDKHKRLLDQILYLFREVGNEDKRYWLPGDDHNYVIEFQKNADTGIYDVLSKRIWKEIGAFATREQAMEAGQVLYSHLRKLNMESEGFYLVDHILLRPRSEKNTYGVHFASKELDLSFNSNEEYDFHDLQLATIKLVYRLRKSVPKLVPEKTGGMWLYMVDNDEELGYSTRLFLSEAEAESYVNNAVRPFFEKFGGIDFFDTDAVQLFKSYYEDTDIDGQDYSFRTTVVLPNWTYRFGNPEFQQALENAFRLECPAHVAIDFKWVSYTDMLHFESMYSPWLEALRTEHEQVDRINEYSTKILQFLKADVPETQSRSVIRYFNRKKKR